MAQITGTSGNDTLTGTTGNDTLNGDAGYNVVAYRGSEYDYIVTRQSDGSVSVRAIAGTPYELDGTDTLSNIQLIKFLDGATERILDDVANMQASTNLVVAFGAQTLGQTFIGDQDWYQVTGGLANQAIHISFAGSDGSSLLANTANISSNTWPEQIQATTLDTTGALAVKVYNNSLALNSVNPYRFTVMRDLIGTDAAETLTAGTTAEYLEGKGGNDSLVGSERSDYLLGGAGDDTLVGGAGDDTLIGGDGANDKDVAVFSGRFSEYSITASNTNIQNPAQEVWWKVTHNSSGQIDYVKGVEVLRFADRDYVVDDYDVFAGTDIQSQTSFARMGEVINGRFSTNYDDDWIAFDFGRGVVDKTTTLKVTVTINDASTPVSKYLSFVNATGFKLQFTDLSDNSSKNSFDFNWYSGTKEYLIKGVQWGPNAEGGAFGGNTTFLVMDSEWGGDRNLNDANQGAYSISISRYRAGTSGDDVLSTDGATEQARADEVAGLGGNDKITGTDRAEAFDGGVGNDTLNAGAGNDRLKGGAGTDALYGEAGDDTFLIAGETTVDDLFDGGSGTDTLSIGNDVNLTGASFNSVEVLQGTGQRVTVSATQLAGFTTANNLIFSGANQDLGALGGSYTLEGTTGDDVLKAGAGDNVIRPFAGNNTVVGGAGNDTVVWESGAGPNWDMQNRAEQVISSTTSGTNYVIQGNYSGGEGSDALKFLFNNNLYNVLGSSRWENERPSTELPYGIDLSQATLQGFESIELSRGSYNYSGVAYSYGPSAIYLTAAQYAGLSALSGGNFVIKGGGTVNLNAVTLANGAKLSVMGDEAYTLTGTAASETLTTNGGNDSIVAGDGKDTISGGAGQDSIAAGAGDDVIIISNKSNVTDVINGAEGTDTLRITGSDVDLSNANLTSIEKLEANSASLALTQAQYDQFKVNLTGTAGLILKMTTPGQASVASLPAGFVGIRGTEGNDVLTGGSGADLLVGDAGNDSLTGGAGNDRLVAGAGSDTLRGGEGDDTLTDLPGETGGLIDGGAGTDTFVADSADPSIVGLTFVDVERVTSSSGRIKVALTQDYTGFTLYQISSVELAQAGRFDYHSLPVTWSGAVIAAAGNDTLIGRDGNDTIDGGAGYNVVAYRGSEYDYIVTRQSDGSVSVRAIAGTPYELDGTDTLRNIQLVKFLDGATERILDDVANIQASTNLVVAFGAQTLGQTFIGDQDWYQVTGGLANQAIHISFAGSDGSSLLANTANISSNTWPEQIQATTLDTTGALAVKVYNNSLALNSVNPYRFTVMRDLIGTDAAETLTAGTTAEYPEGKGGNDSLVGSERSDYLLGGAGDDTLVGGAGDDTLIGGDGANDKDVAVFSGRLSEYSIKFSSHSAQNPASDVWWKVTQNSTGQIDYLKGVEVLRFADRDYVVDDYDVFTGTDIQSQTSFARMGEAVKGQTNLNDEDDWIAFDFGRSVVDRSTTLKLTLNGLSPNFSANRAISFVNATGLTLQFKDLADGATKTSLNFSGSVFSNEYLIQGVQWGANAEGGYFGGGQTFVVVDGQWADFYYYRDSGLSDASATQFGSYSFSISRYRAGTSGDDVLSTDGATEQARADEVAGLGGNDKITGTDRAEAFDGGVGNDTLNAGAGNDRLKGGAGTDALYGEAGDDTFLIAGETTVDDLFDGGSGTDTLSIGNDVNLTGASFNSVEVLQGTGQRVTVSATQLAGFTTANNLIFSGANQDLGALGGSYTLEGTTGDDVLKAGAGDNVIRPFAGNNTVVGGAGNDTVVWESGAGPNWDMQNRAEQVISSTISGSNYVIQGNYSGGEGSDALKFVFNNNLYNVLGSWRWESERPGTELPYGIDLSQATLQGFESIELSRGSYNYGGVAYSYGPSAIYLTAAQYAGLSALSGGNFVIKGGGTVNLNAVTLASGATVSVMGDEAYTLTGTAASETLTTNGGNDSIVAGDGKDTISGGAGQDSIAAGAGDDVIIISNKSNVTDVINGAEGTDTLRITGSDVDLSNANLTSIEKLEANSASLALTQAQYDQFKVNLTGTAGLILKMTTPGQASVASLPAGFVGIRGTEGNDVLTGGSGADLLVGDAGNDSLTGGAGNDRLVAGAGSDTLRGGEGDDQFSVDGVKAPTSVIDGGAGTDRMMVSDGMNLTGVTFSSVEQLTGSGTVTLNASQLASFVQVAGANLQLNDTKNSFAMGEVSISPTITVYLKDADANLMAEKGVVGTAQDDTLIGGVGDDRLLGGRGADAIQGGLGNDTLLGGSGYDTLLGGAGNDVFWVESSDIKANGTLNSDHLDGGEGFDTLKIDFSGTSWNTYRLVEGSVSSIEKIDAMGGEVSQVYLSADQFNSLKALNSSGNNLRLFIEGAGQDVDLGAITTNGLSAGVRITGSVGDVNASALTLGNGTGDWWQLEYASLHLNQFDSVKLSAGNDTLRVFGDGQFVVDAGSGNDWIRLEGLSEKLQATVKGGAGTDTFDISTLGFVDLTKLSLVDVESIKQGGTTVVVTPEQLAAWSFDGSGTKYTRVGNTIVGSASNDNYTGTGTEFFQGGRGDDYIANVHTAVFNGNFADYNFSQSKNPLTIEQARGSMTDGKDTLYGVLNLKFADTTVKIDDAPNENYYPYYRSNASAWDSLTHADYAKRVSGKKDYTDDSDLYAATFAPNSPLAVEGSTFNGSSWRMAFWDVSTGGQINFKSLVNGSQYGEWYNWMDANGKFLPLLNGNAYQGGNVVARMYVDGDIQDYAFTLNFMDDYAGSVDTLGSMDALQGVTRGYVGDIGDSDWIRTSLIAGTKYEFKLMGVASDGGTLLDPKLELRDSEGRLIDAGLDYAANDVGGDDTVVFRPSATGTYYLAASDVGKVATGSWTLTQKSLDTIAGNTSTTERIEWSGANTFTASSEINVLSDHDWFKVWLNKGITYELRALGVSQGGTLADPQLSVRSATGILLAQDDNSGGSSDAKLSYSAPDSGWYFLDAGASGNTSKGTYILKGKTLDDDFSNDRLTTGVLQVGKPLPGLISYKGDSDWLKVGLTKGQVYVIDLVGDMSDSAQLDPLVDPLLVVRDKDGEVIARYDDFTGSLNARAYFTPSEDGLYFLEAKSAFKYDIGAYQMSVSVAPPDDFASAMNDTAAALTLGEAKTGDIGIPGDHDVFKVSLQQGNTYQVSVNGLANHDGTLADPYVRIFDSQGRLVDFDNNGGLGNDAQLYIEAKTSGTYFIEASSNKDRGMGTYQVAVAQRALPADEAPGNVGTTVFIKPGDTFSGNLLTHHDQDWFGIRLEAGQDYVFKLQASQSGNGSLADPVLALHAADGTTLKSVDNMLVGNEPAFVYTPTLAGTYYLAVKAADGANDVGSYTLTTRQPDDVSNTKQAAQTVALDQVVTAGIQWSDGAYGVRAYDSIGLSTDSDEDWYQWTATAGQVLSVNVEAAVGSTLSRPMVEIVSADNRSMAIGDGLETLNGRAVATFKAPEAGTYYARVIDAAGATGAYTLSLSAGDASDEDARAPLQLSFATQGNVVQAQAQAKIGLSGDSDQFKVALEKGHSYRVETLAVRDGILAPLGSAKLALSWLAQGAATPTAVDVNTVMGTPSFFDATEFSATDAGTLSIEVAALDTTQTGQYKLRVVDLGAAQPDDHPDRVVDYVDGNHGVLASNESASGRIDEAGDIDLYAINLTVGNIYDFSVKSYADGLGTLSQADLRLLDGRGQWVTSGLFDVTSGRNDLAVSVFESGRYYLAVSATDLPGNTGSFTLDTRLRGSDAQTDDIRADAQSGVTAGPGRTASGKVDYAGDHDWIRTTLTAGKVYVLDVLADGQGAGGTLKDATLRLLDAQGIEIAFDDDSGAGLDAHLQFTASQDADYFLDVASNGTQTGTYTVRVRELYSGIADPLKSAQWYLSALGLDALHGQITGAGVTVGMIDDGIDTAHPDLQKQIDFALSYDTVYNTADGKNKLPYPLNPAGDFHGTAVAGLIVAEQNNETGIVGVAPDAEIASVRVKWSWDQITEALGKQWQFDVSNNSWGAIDPFADNFNSTTLTFAYEGLRTGVEDGRDGLGTVFVFSAGNSSGYGDNTNYHNFQNAREVITVAATQADGSVASFSTPGASVLIGAYGVDLLTTDRHEKGQGLNTAGNYTSFTGTSAAAPVVSGVAALMLEANPNLGYRDVQEILVYSAWHPDNQDWKTNAASNFNLGGLQFNDQTGFGVVDAYSAVRLAQSWTKQSTALNEVSASARKFGLIDAIPDGDGTSFSQTFAIDANMLVQHVELGVDLRHTRLGDLVIELVSPSGTVSTLMNRPTVNSEQPFGLSGMDSGVPTHLLWDFSSVQFWGEQASGDWTIRVKDLRAEEAGTLSSMSLRLYGERDTGNNVYVFTEEGFQSATRRVLNDEAGIDTLNAAPMRHDMYVDLPQGIIAAEGVTYTVSPWSVLENIVTGIGSDNVVANDANNLIRTFEGNDTLQGGKGDDSLDGGAGFDVATYSGNMEEFRVSWNPNLKTVTVVDGKSDNGHEGTDTLMGIERIVFHNGELNLAATVGNKAPTATQQLFDTPVLIGKGMGIDYAIPASAFTDPEQGNAADLQVTVTSASGGELPEWLAYDPVTRSFSGVPPQDYQGQLKLLVTAVDDFNQSVSDILTLQFGSNQSPLLASPSELSLKEDAPLTNLGLNVPTDPEGKTVRVKVLEIPAQGKLLDKQGNPLTVDAFLTADGLSEVHYQPAADVNGDMGYFRYQAIDEDGVMAESAVHLFVDPVNDAPRFATSGSKLMVQYPLTQAVTLDIAKPSDPESTLSQVTVVDLPAMGVVRLGAVAVSLNQVLSFEQLGRLSFTLAENVNGPIGGVTVRATDPQGLSTDWTLSLEVQGNNVNNTGTSGPDAMYGSNATDTLYGMGGDDLLVGNAGNDRLLGGLGNDTLLGGAGNDALDGSSGNDELDGGLGTDTLSGGPGNDTYTVDLASDVVLEVISGGAGGKDLVVTSVSLTAPANIESLQALPGQALNLTGNSLDNILSGNELANSLAGGVGRDTLIGGAGNDSLDGGAGVDRLAGGTGDDTYAVDSRSDVIVELANEGTDTVYASASYTLPSQVEILILQEGGDYSAGGNSLNNRLEGNAGHNVLAGGLGKDTLVGGLGNDIYVLSDNLDTLVDAGGIDTVRSSLDVVLATGFENAELVGIVDATATGNAADNLLQGNMGDNILEGKGGVDTLSGGAGSDQFVLGYNGLNTVADQITDFASGQDLLVIDLASFGISTANLNLQSSGTLNAASFVKGPGVRALDTNDYFLLDTAQSLLKFDQDGSGPLAAMDVVRFVGVVDAAFNGADLFIAV